jgi:hypothetical protein
MLSLLIGATLLAGCDTSRQASQRQVDAADSIYTGGDIVTVNDQQPPARALREALGIDELSAFVPAEEEVTLPAA